MAGFLDILGDIVGAIIPKSIYDPHTGQLFGGALSGAGLAGMRSSGDATGTIGFAPRRRAYQTTAYLASETVGGVPPQGVLAAGTGLGGAAVAGAAGALVRVVPGLAKYLPAIERVVPKVLAAAGLGEAIYAIYEQLRGSGMAHKSARRAAITQATGVIPRRRRMRVTNIHALRRAIRRVHGFRRVARKVGALGTRRGGKLMPWHRVKRYRRGDVSPFMVEDYAEMLDEAEDFDLNGETFSDSAMGE